MLFLEDINSIFSVSKKQLKSENNN
ncbi:hypothetical protein CY0110_16212 [Crocosphaera chwakensis CCY0110]|uniref:Uncharacterized protein n=1 Tax=Crocosphaera chwakensis CCY0110 TaxID=391612 RepID=A3IHS4_9CHRO|nr:hypothetical protein CY0110_16212 [Crocosphaera chwakensis CCY0110]